MDQTTLSRLVPVVSSDPCCAIPAPTTLTPAHVEQLAEQLKALADATRLRMLDLLAQQSVPLCVCAITVQFDQHQPTISHHLRILREASLVDCERRGVWAYYWATEMGKQRLALVETLP